MLSLFEISALLLTVSAFFGWINNRFIEVEDRDIGNRDANN